MKVWMGNKSWCRIVFWERSFFVRSHWERHPDPYCDSMFPMYQSFLHIDEIRDGKTGKKMTEYQIAEEFDVPQDQWDWLGPGEDFYKLVEKADILYSYDKESCNAKTGSR